MSKPSSLRSSWRSSGLRGAAATAVERMREPFEVRRWVAVATVVGLLVIIGVLLLAQRRGSTHVDLDAVPAYPDAARAIAMLTGGVLLEGNAARIVENGAFFDELVEDIEKASLQVHLETYIWSKGSVTTKVGGALVAAAKRGVKVRLVMDAVGGHDSGDILDELREAGGEVVQYRPIGLTTWHAQNYRDHRKLVVLDGRIAWIMGHGFAEEWAGDGQDADHWRDTAVRLEGPVVSVLQSEFTNAWLSSSGQGFVEPEATGVQPAAGSTAIHVVSSSSGETSSTVAVMFEAALRSSREDVVVTTPYFAPNDRILEAMRDAAKRGVGVRLLVPGKPTDSRAVRHASHAHFAPLLEAGVRIWEHHGTMVHQKIMVVDGQWSHVGSTNMDMRSLEMSEERSVGIVDPLIAGQLTQAFEKDIAGAEEITAEWMTARSPWHRFIDGCARLARNQL